jgi:hypothetical protein
VTLERVRKIYKWFRWFVLITSLFGVILLFKSPARISPAQPGPSAVADNAKSFQDKLGELEAAHQRGENGAVVRISADEVAAAVTQANADPQVTPTATHGNPADPNAPVALTPEQVPVKDTQVVFEGDEVKCQFTAQVYGKDMVVTLSGRLGSRDGYVTFNPTGFMIGSMPVPISAVQAQLDKKLSEPDTRERLKLPEFISDLKIEDGQLVLVEK